MPDDGPDFLQGFKVYFFVPSIHVAKARIRIWTPKIVALGGEVIQDPARDDINVVVVGNESVPAALAVPKAPLVSTAWLEDSLAKGQLLPIKQYITEVAHRQATKRKAEEARGPMSKFEPWLGFWRPEFDKITLTVELVLQAKFSARSGVNEPLVALLVELYKFECAVLSEHGASDEGETVNHNALQYARAAAVVRACAFRINPAIKPGQLPFVGESTARVIASLAESGSCAELEAFRAGRVVSNSKGEERPETEGANIRRQFVKLPGVGVRTAQQWWEAGHRSLEEVEEAVGQEDGLNASKTQRFSILHRGDLLEVCAAEDIEEMRCTLLRVLSHLTGGEWQLWPVGGARRSVASHDADFVVSHPSISTEGVLPQLVEALLREKRLVPKEEGMCIAQSGKMGLHMESMKQVTPEQASHRPNLEADRYDRLVGIFITKAGKHRRMDVIMSPWEEVPLCLISWTGSKQYNRFLRLHATNRKMSLNAHRLMRLKNGVWCIIPDEAAPLDREGNEFWPPGWTADRRINCEADVFELLGIPYREPWERNCQ